ncbi:MAG: hypothetical protein H0V79_07400 [Actinobacteria bacterium]|nr:hypothetical protein [Actinomycetota bacterium]
MGAKKRQTMGKIMRERERAEKRALKKEKKDGKKAEEVARREAEALGIPYVGAAEVDEGENWNDPGIAVAGNGEPAAAPAELETPADAPR